jgi:hypothetical protein
LERDLHTWPRGSRKREKFVPYVSTSLILAETSVTDQHWSLRNGRPNQKR